MLLLWGINILTHNTASTTSPNNIDINTLTLGTSIDWDPRLQHLVMINIFWNLTHAYSTQEHGAGFNQSKSEYTFYNTTISIFN